jgi:hypothetical protein
MQIGKLLILAGVFLILLGLLWWGASLLGWTDRIGKLPGDFGWKGENFYFYFPLSTSILLSVLVSLIFYLWSRFRG